MPGAPSLGYHESSHVLLTPYTGVRRQVRENQLGPALVESRSLSRYYWVTQLTVQYDICSRITEDSYGHSSTCLLCAY